MKTNATRASPSSARSSSEIFLFTFQSSADAGCHAVVDVREAIVGPVSYIKVMSNVVPQSLDASTLNVSNLPER